jgi:hypothetical protein
LPQQSSVPQRLQASPLSYRMQQGPSELQRSRHPENFVDLLCWSLFHSP